VPLEEREARLVLMSKGWEEDVSPYRLMVASRLQPDAPQALDALMRTSITGQNATLVSRLSGAIDLVDQLPGIDIPTLVAHSRDDLSVSIRESHLLASLIPGARLLEIQSRNHVLTSTEPGWSEFLVGLRGFLSDGSGSQTRDGSGTSATPGGLTDREVEVLRLISNGHTDKAIADVLGVSVRTVGSYVQNVLEKSQSASRAQAAVWGARQGVL
jgi:DNA-binding CsgD family transcriptional regulator